MKEYVEFSNGQKMPLVGLGTWQANNAEELETALNEAFNAGYRHFDTAYMYLNEEIIGKVLKQWLDSGKVKREELFITTKLPMIAMKPEKVEEFIKKSLSKLQLDYADLYLVHMPIGLTHFSDTEIFPIRDGNLAVDKSTDLEAIWKAMENQIDAGRAKAIGISNFNHKQIERIIKIARIRPSNLQIEIHAYFQQKPLREFCAQNSITVCSYASIGSAGRKELYAKRGLVFSAPNILEDPVVKEIAAKLNKSGAQVLLRFLVQQEIIVIPKSTNPERLQQNFQLFNFEISDEDMKKLEALDKGAKGRTFNFTWSPAGYTDHPENPLLEPY